jgi:hypothetical protein
MRARFVPPPPEEAELPRSLLERLAILQVDPECDVLVLAARFLSPLTTQSVADGSRFVFDALGR